MNRANSPIEESKLDFQTRLGRFGWFEISVGNYLPTLFREKSRFLCVRMFESNLLASLLQQIPFEAIKCLQVNAYSATEQEVKLLNEINSFHADYRFGHTSFNTKDLLIKCEDASKALQYIQFCIRQLDIKRTSPGDKCGFKRIGDTSDIPFVNVDGVDYLPCFYFEGTNIGNECIELRGLDWSYLKFCCKLQGVRDEFLQAECCDVVPMKEILTYLPDDIDIKCSWTECEDFFGEGRKSMNNRITRGESWKNSWLSLTPSSQLKTRLFQGSLERIRNYTVNRIIGSSPYKLSKVLLLKRYVPCVNIRPYEFLEVMIALPKLVSELFPLSTDLQVGFVLTTRDITIFQGNCHHIKLSKEAGWQGEYENLPFVTLADIMVNLSVLQNKLKYGRLKVNRNPGD